MRLLVDVGNTTTNLGIERDGVLKDTFRLQTNTSQTADELWHHWKSIADVCFDSQMKVVVASVVPDLTRKIRKAVQENTQSEAFFLEPPWDSVNIEIDMKNPGKIGADRIAGAKALLKYYGGGVIVDFGTATTVDFVDSERVYRGGVILPGVKASAQGLSKETALLPRVSLDTPENFQYKKTTEALQSGLLYGTAGAVDRVIYELRDNSSLKSSTVVATGGDASVFLDLCDEINEIEPNLVLKGLNGITV